MPDTPKLERNIRKELEDILFPGIATPQAQRAALDDFLSLAGPLVRPRLARVADRIGPDLVPTRNILRGIIGLIITSHVARFAANWDTPRYRAALIALSDFVGESDARLASLARAFAGRGDAADDKVRDAFLEATGIEMLAEADTEDLGADEGGDMPDPFVTEDEVVVVGGAGDTPDTGTDSSDTNSNSDTSNEADTMPDQPPQNIFDAFTANFAFDAAKLPRNLQYDTSGTTETLSSGQRNYIRGVEDALVKLGMGNKPGMRHAVIGLLLADGTYDPDDRAFYDNVRKAVDELKSAASSSGEGIVVGNDAFEASFSLRSDVFAAAYGVLEPMRPIFADAFGKVGRAMVDLYDTRPPGSAGFAAATTAKYNDVTLAGAGGDGGGSGIAFLDLPPLSGGGMEDQQIVPDNIRAMSAIYVVYQCEQMMLFPVVDRIVELFMAGLLPMSGDNLARKLDDYYWDKDDRVSPNGRAAQYTRALNAGGGNVGRDVTANVEFNELLERVIFSTSEYNRQQTVSEMFETRGRRAKATTGEQVRKAVRDLAANCTLYGYAGTQFAAERMGTQLKRAMEILSLPRIKQVYGVNSMWQVIERVAQSEFGTTVNIVKHRTLAEEVRTILDIVARRSTIWSLSSGNKLFAEHEDDTADLSYADSMRMFQASQYYLAVNGVQDDHVAKMSQPADTPATPTIPGFGSFGGQDMPAMGGGNDVSGQLRDMLAAGQTPSPDQIRSMIGM
ncbi:hypothetical protein [uncultured Tateyamaria sp.]|uniref:hypothetical protein n=1 Tax=Tateyamaria sp. 1078 TaxID=3417464 RepID=UPI002631A080|nr:hypothetical protein [uncultured Tateyamaria sp.]